MTAYEFISIYSKKSEKEQKQTIVSSFWGIDAVDGVLESMGFGTDCISDESKAKCLEKAVDTTQIDETAVLDAIEEELWALDVK